MMPSFVNQSTSIEVNDETRATIPECEAAAAVKQITNAASIQTPFHTAVILGSGLGYVADAAIDDDGVVIPFAEIPHQPEPAVKGHSGRLVCGKNSFEGIIFVQGRVHYYEGHSLSRTTFIARLLHQLGVRTLIVSNAAGGIRSDFQVGDLMLLEGHLSFVDLSPLHTRSVVFTGQRTLSLWSPHLLELAQSVQSKLKIHRGTYAMMSGPNYETKSEIRMLHKLGADAVGMSTVPEAFVAACLGIDVLGVSCITNKAAGLGDGFLHHDEVSHAASQIERDFSSWLIGVLELISQYKNC